MWWGNVPLLLQTNFVTCCDFNVNHPHVRTTCFHLAPVVHPNMALGCVAPPNSQVSSWLLKARLYQAVSLRANYCIVIKDMSWIHWSCCSHRNQFWLHLNFLLSFLTRDLQLRLITGKQEKEGEKYSQCTLTRLEQRFPHLFAHLLEIPWQLQRQSWTCRVSSILLALPPHDIFLRRPIS